ncbi:MAG: TRAP transporter small permease [Synergistaceae bacterium]|jgi:TRAP-type C4-dicarboxylate transport system permease small subunit|nr:TRAP transporter small permease [Synergistaceae bacterium]
MKYADILIKLIEGICTALLILMTVVCFAQVINRYVFSRGFRWAEEMAIYANVWLIFLGAVVCVRRDRHTRIDFLLLILPYKVRKFLEIFGYLICIVFLALLTYHIQPLIKGSKIAKSIGMRIPLNVLNYAVPVGSVLMIVYLTLMIYLKWNEKERPKLSPYDSGQEGGGAL